MAPLSSLANLDRAGPEVDRGFARATATAAVGFVAVGVAGTLVHRRLLGVALDVPSWPWYHSWPYYLFWSPRLHLGWALAAVPTAGLATALTVLLAGARAPRPARLAGAVACAFVLALAVAALAGGPAAWWHPLGYQGEYPGGVAQVGSVRAFLAEFAARVPSLPDFAAQHPPGALLFYVGVDRVWSGLPAAALATVAAGSLGALVVAGLARDELGEEGERLAVACWSLAPMVVLYLATSADAVWAPVLAGAALASHRGLARRAWGWVVAGGVLLWLASMLTFAAVLVLPFLAVRALARWATEPGWVVRWAGGTTLVVLGLAGGLQLVTGYDVVATVEAVNRFWTAAPGSQRDPWVWSVGNLLAFGAAIGFPLAAAFVVRLWTVVRERAWGSFELAAAANLVAGAVWGHTKGEVERMWQFLVPFAVVVAVRQLLRWRAPLPVVAALLAGQALAVQVLFYTRW